jgi:ribosomal protein L40E
METEERILMEGPAKFRVREIASKDALFPGEILYNDTEGVLALTNRRFIFCFLPFTRAALTSDFMFIAPLEMINSVSNKGWGYSVLIIETDTTKVTGPPTNEFLVYSSGKWVDTFRELQNERTRKIQPELPLLHLQEEPQVDKRFEKICLSCMGVVPEDAEVCPRCGNKFLP